MYARAAADAREDAVWSARRDTLTGYGIAVFDVDPADERDGQTSITVRYFHALGADPVNPTTGAKGAPSSDYTEFESFTLARPRADRDHGKRSGLPGPSPDHDPGNGAWLGRSCDAGSSRLVSALRDTSGLLIDAIVFLVCA